MFSYAIRAGAAPGTAALKTAPLAARMLSSSAARPSATAGYRLNHCMMRIKDPATELPFYKVLGMDLVHEMDGGDFVNYFVSYPPAPHEADVPLFSRQGLVELCWNKGTEKQEGNVYVSGNEEPNRGFGHIAISVPDLAATVQRLDDAGVQFRKRPEEGRMRDIAFALSPTGYWVEIVQQRK